MFVEEGFDFGFVDVVYGFGGDGDFVVVFVFLFGGEGVDVGEGGDVVVEDVEGEEFWGGDGGVWVVGEVLVVGEVVVDVGFYFGLFLSIRVWDWGLGCEIWSCECESWEVRGEVRNGWNWWWKG